MLLFTSLSAAAYSSYAFALAALVRLLSRSFPLSLCFQLVDGVGRDPFRVLCLLLAKDLFARVVLELLAVFPLCLNIRLSFSVSFCSGWNLLERLIWKAACVSLFLGSPTLYLVRVLLALVNFLRRSLTVAIRRWWSDDTSAPLITRTSRHDLLICGQCICGRSGSP